MQQHCSGVLKRDIPGIISCGLCFGANQHKKITDFQNRSCDDDLSMVLDDKRNARLPRGLL